MAIINLAKLVRPNTVSIFARDPLADPTIGAKITAFVLTNTVIPSPGRVRLDLTQSMSGGNRVTATRSPVERVVADNIRREPRTLTVTGSLSANPLGLLAAQLGIVGSIVRRDLRERKKLLAMIDEPVAVVTPFEIFPSMAMSVDDTHDGSNKVELTLSFEEVRIVSPLTVAGALDLDTLLVGAGSTTNLGAQPTDLVAAPVDVAGGVGG